MPVQSVKTMAGRQTGSLKSSCIKAATEFSGLLLSLGFGCMKNLFDFAVNLNIA